MVPHTTRTALAFAALAAIPAAAADATITLNPLSRYQTIEGFGAMTTTAPPAFLASDLGVSMSRFNLPTRFCPSKGTYSTAAIAGEFARMNALKAAGITRWITSVWTPPGWMKDMSRDRSASCWDGPNECGGHLSAARYQDFTDMVVAYCKEVKKQTGVDLYAFSIQNELEFAQPYISCVYTPDEYAAVVKLLGPALKAAGLPVRLYGPETMIHWARDFETPLMRDANGKDNFGAFAYHGYVDGVNPVSSSEAAAKWRDIKGRLAKYGKPLWMTETSGMTESWEGAANLAGNIYAALRHGDLTAWTFWLECGSGAASGSLEGLLLSDCTHSLRSLVSKNYYKWIRPDAVRINAGFNGDSTGLFAVAFDHTANKTLTIVLLNTNSSSRTVSIDGGNCPAGLQHFSTSRSERCVDKGSVSSAGVTVGGNSVNTLYATGYESPLGIRHQTVRFAVAQNASPLPAAMQAYDLRGKHLGAGAVTRTNTVTVVKAGNGCPTRVRINYASYAQANK